MRAIAFLLVAPQLFPRHKPLQRVKLKPQTEIKLQVQHCIIVVISQLQLFTFSLPVLDIKCMTVLIESILMNWEHNCNPVCLLACSIALVTTV